MEKSMNLKAVGVSVETGSRATAYFLLSVAIILAGVAFGISSDVTVILEWIEHIFGFIFIGLMAGLVLAALFCRERAIQGEYDSAWLEGGLQAASGVTTLALTYTLLGISLGIGTLAEYTLTPDTVQEVIRDLTQKFSMAFMTTVIGLPIAAVLRTFLIITHAKHHQDMSNI